MEYIYCQYLTYQHVPCTVSLPHTAPSQEHTMIDMAQPVRIDPSLMDFYNRQGISDPLLLKLERKDLVVVDARAKHVYVRDPADSTVHRIERQFLKFG